MNKEEKELIDKLSLAVSTFNITAINNPNMIILRNDLRKVLDICLRQKEVIDKLEKKIKLVKQYDFDKVGRYELLEILKEVSK